MLILCYLIASDAAQGKEGLFLTELMASSIFRRVGASIRKVNTCLRISVKNALCGTKLAAFSDFNSVNINNMNRQSDSKL